MQNNILHNKTFLVIEDSHVCMALIRAFLRGTGAILLTAATGKEGWRKFTENKVDIVIMDLRLPDTDGLSLIRELKAGNPDIPVMVQTACTVYCTENDCREAGCDSYITKPYSHSMFLNTAEKTLEKAGRLLPDHTLNHV